MASRGHRVMRLPLGPEAKRGTFVAPAIVEIRRIADVEREVFGPSSTCCATGGRRRPAHRRDQRLGLRSHLRSPHPHRRDHLARSRPDRGRETSTSTGTSSGPSSACSPSADAASPERGPRPAARSISAGFAPSASGGAAGHRGHGSRARGAARLCGLAAPRRPPDGGGAMRRLRVAVRRGAPGWSCPVPSGSGTSTCFGPAAGSRRSLRQHPACFSRSGPSWLPAMSRWSRPHTRRRRPWPAVRRPSTALSPRSRIGGRPSTSGPCSSRARRKRFSAVNRQIAELDGPILSAQAITPPRWREARITI